MEGGRRIQVRNKHGELLATVTQESINEFLLQAQVKHLKEGRVQIAVHVGNGVCYPVASQADMVEYLPEKGHWEGDLVLAVQTPSKHVEMFKCI